MINIAKKLLAKDFIEDGRWIHLMTGGSDPEPLYADKEQKLPCRALVRSRRCIGMTKVNESLGRKTLGIARLNNTKAKDIEDGLRKTEIPRRFAVVLAALENCNTEKPGIQTFTETELLEAPVYGADGVLGEALAYHPDYDWLINQVVDYAFDDRNYDPEAEKAKPKGNGEAAGAQDQA